MDLDKHLRERGMNPDLYTNVIYDHEEEVVTFFLHNFLGHIVGYQTYRPNESNKKAKNDPKNGRYYTYLPGKSYVGESADPKKVDIDGVWGVEAIDKDRLTMFVVEGVFKAAVLHRLGFNAVATLTATPKRLKPLFSIMKVMYNVVAIGDPDAAGKKLVNIVGNGFTSPLDLDEMSDEDILILLENNVPNLYKTRSSLHYG